MIGTLYGVSVGPGDPELMTLKAVRIIRACGVVAVPRSAAGNDLVALSIARQAVPELDEKELVELSFPMTRDISVLTQSRTEAAERLAAYLRAGKDVAFLTIGDASIYSTYSYLHELILNMGLPAQMIAGVPSFCAVAARLNHGLTEASSPLHILPASYDGTGEGLAWKGTKVLMKTGKSLGKVKALLREQGLYDNARLVQNCGLAGERVFESLNDADDSTGYLSIIVVKD